MKKLASMPLLLFAACCFASAQAQTSRSIAEGTFPSVVLLVTQDSNGQTLSLGSGFFVGSDIVATNLHVIEKAAKGYARIVGQDRKYEVAGDLPPVFGPVIM